MVGRWHLYECRKVVGLALVMKGMVHHFKLEIGCLGGQQRFDEDNTFLFNGHRRFLWNCIRENPSNLLVIFYGTKQLLFLKSFKAMLVLFGNLNGRKSPLRLYFGGQCHE